MEASSNQEELFINQKDGLLYRRLEGGCYHIISQKMTVLQELESFRKADGVVRMTSRSRGRIPTPFEKTLAKEWESFKCNMKSVPFFRAVILFTALLLALILNIIEMF